MAALPSTPGQIGVMKKILIPLFLASLAGAQEVKTAEQVYKNIQVLQGLPQPRLLPAMAFIAASLGVSCDHCHLVSEPFKDEKPAKLAARRMISLTRELNEKHYAGALTVNCYTCHQGRLVPVSVPVIAEAPPAATAKAAAEPLPAAAAVFDGHVQALGGRTAIEKITTRVAKGFLEAPGGPPLPIQKYQKAPNRLLMMLRLPNGQERRTGYDGSRGWENQPGRKQSREMQGDDLARTRREADFYWDLRLAQLLPNAVVTGRQKVRGRDAIVLESGSDKLFFDAQTSLLLRFLQINQSPLGPVPFQVEFDDYREADGVKTPFLIRWARPDLALTFRFEEVRQNLPIDGDRFRKPAQ